MMIGTLAVYRFGMATGSSARAATPAFTTFVPFQFFSLFNARSERSSAFDRGLLSNRMLWTSLAGVAGLQVVAVQWPPAQTIFRTVGLGVGDWCVAVAVAASILLLEGLREAITRHVIGSRTAPAGDPA